MHRRVGANELDLTDKLKSAIDALVVEQGVLEKLPTWPWRPGTLGVFGTAIGVPLLLTAANIILQRLFN